MNGDDLARLAYLSLLAVAVAGWFFTTNRESMGKTAQQAVVWLLIFVGLVAGYGLWNDIQRDIMPSQSQIAGGVVELPRGFDGHYSATLIINDVPIDFIVDTGATQIVLTQRDAERVGIDTETLTYFGQAQTANGIVRTAPVTLGTVELGDIQDRRIGAVVNEGQMEGSLLGMTYLNLFDRIEITDERMILTR